MGKFADINIKNNTDNNNITQMNSGGHNVQNTQIINKTVNNNYNKTSSNNDDGFVFFGAAIIVMFGVGFLIWSFFCNYEKIYPILKAGSITSPLLSIFALIILIIKSEAELPDFIRTLALSTLGVLIFLSNENLNIYVPQDILELSRQANSVTDFWTGLNGYGKNLSLSIISTGILIFISIILTYLSSFRELSYSLANKDMSGFWFSLLKITNIFRAKFFGMSGITLLLISFTILILKGYIFNMSW
ncbi:DUF2157 domain-containing protein [Dickeya dadantii]|uniref:DUF2157 domain-containing protein n=1 Tax=Dickeya dadantii TaxID=204038 RepID=UPI0021DAF0BB|nr:DUF2157 domain-containing protein [Dickeya dadantii]